MKIFLFGTVLAVAMLASHSNAFFVSPSVTKTCHPSIISLKAADLSVELDEIGHKLRLHAFDVDTGVYGFESKDRFYGIENIRTQLHFEPSLGLELTEVAHSDVDHRGLVFVSKVDGNAMHEGTPIHVGDTIVGVFVGEDFKESTTGFDYELTTDVISRAKNHAIATGQGHISLELNRLVKRATVQVEIEEEHGKVTTIEALAGDNLRLVLMHHHAKLYDGKTPRLDQPSLTSDCGGEGICGTCLVAVRKGGMSHLNDIGPQESSILMGRPATWRAACKTIVGADNEEGTTLRVRLHPQSSQMENLLP
jgi:hypothetical protein